MTNRLYVGNIPFRTSEEDLRELFARDGKEVVECRIITDRETGRSRGFGFVEMGTEEDAEKSIESLDGLSFEGRNLKVNYAREQQKRRPPQKRF